MRTNAAGNARKTSVLVLLLVLAAQAITPDSQDLSSTALLRHLGTLRAELSRRADGDQPVPWNAHHLPRRPGRPRGDQSGDETPDELCTPDGAQTMVSASWVRDANSHSGPSAPLGTGASGQSGQTHLPLGSADANGAARSIYALCRQTC